MRRRPHIVIDSLGRLAARTLDTAHQAQIGPVLDRCLYVTSDRGAVCIGLPGIGRGPLNALVATESHAAFSALIADPGGLCTIRHGQIAFPSSVVVDHSQAKLWDPPPWPALATPDRIATALAHVKDVARPRHGSIAEALWHPSALAGLDGAIARRAVLALATLTDCLRAGANGDRASARATEAGTAAVRTLLGLGVGFTPAGDDVLAGLLLGFAAAGRSADVHWLTTAIQRAPSDATTPVSRAFFAAAAEGQAPAALILIVTGMLSGHSGNHSALAAIDTIGHTSGWDLLAGLWTALSLVADASGPPAHT